MSEAPEFFRVFISIEVTVTIIERLSTLQRSMDESIPRGSVRWTPSEQMHLTLKFLGDVPGTEIPSVESALQPVGRGHASFQLSARGLGAFPNARNPRVLWVGLEGDVENLRQLQSQIEQAVNPWAAQEEHRPFKAHLTLGRVRQEAGRKARLIGESIQTVTAEDFGAWPVTQFRLMRSQLSPKGAIHTCLAEFPLLQTTHSRS